MYRNCIFCSAALGANESIESFPVASRLAFDPGKGRLWAVCGRCARWNLSPIEERWEAVEEAEKRFRDSRMRVHSENIGLSRLEDGTRLIRIGGALPREIAAWRYGDQLVRRRRQAMLWTGAGATIAAGAALGSVALLGAAPLFPVAVHGGTILHAAWVMRNQQKVVHRLPRPDRPNGEPLVLRMSHLLVARLVPDPDGEGIALRIPTLLPTERLEDGGVVRWVAPPPLLVRGADAERLLGKAMAQANARGAPPRRLDHAFARLAAAESRESFLRRMSEKEAGLFPASLANPPGNQTAPLRAPDFGGAWKRFVGSFRGERIGGQGIPLVTKRLARDEALALEMSLHEEAERRALEGEIQALKAAWREAEEIATIADTIPDDPLDRMRAGSG